MQRRNRMGCAALRHYITGTAFALAALGGYSQLKLDVVKAQAGTYMAGNFSVRNSMAYTNNHGAIYCFAEQTFDSAPQHSSWLLKMADYKYELIAFAITLRPSSRNKAIYSRSGC